jgi:hypothetical protein
MRFSSTILGLLPLLFTAVSSSAIPPSDKNPSGMALADVLEARGAGCSVEGAYIINPRRVNRSAQRDINWIFSEESGSDWNNGAQDTNVYIDAQTYTLDGRIAVRLRNTNRRFGNAIILSYYPGTTNGGQPIVQERVEVGVSTGGNGAQNEVCVTLRRPRTAGHWWLQFERENAPRKA